MDKIIAILLLVHACSALPNYPAPVPSYPAPAPSNGYGASTSCRQVEDVSYSEKCEDYTDSMCTTSFNEICDDVRDQTCRATVSSSQSRKCFNVTETVCTLNEEVSFDIIEAVSTVQKCSRNTGKLNPFSLQNCEYIILFI